MIEHVDEDEDDVVMLFCFSLLCFFEWCFLCGGCVCAVLWDFLHLIMSGWDAKSRKKSKSKNNEQKLLSIWFYY